MSKKLVFLKASDLTFTQRLKNAGADSSRRLTKTTPLFNLFMEVNMAYNFIEKRETRQKAAVFATYMIIGMILKRRREWRISIMRLMSGLQVSMIGS